MPWPGVSAKKTTLSSLRPGNTVAVKNGLWEAMEEVFLFAVHLFPKKCTVWHCWRCGTPFVFWGKTWDVGQSAPNKCWCDSNQSIFSGSRTKRRHFDSRIACIDEHIWTQLQLVFHQFTGWSVASVLINPVVHPHDLYNPCESKFKRYVRVVSGPKNVWANGGFRILWLTIDGCNASLKLCQVCPLVV